jgi:photosystem II stability/assembly factor-like uncharacterized protein
LPLRALGGFLVAGGLLGLFLLPAPGGAQQPTRDQQISEIQKQIEALNKKLTELKNHKGPTSAAVGSALPDDWVKALKWRSIGPAAMGGRIVAFAVNEADPTNYWVATASGGLLKTTNNGTTFQHQFDKEATVSIGDVQVARSNPNIVWVGTGENNPRNSVSYGDGVYKSTDGGKTWKNMGLQKTFQIGRIAIHPTNPDIVYVGALGRLYGPSPDRGLYKTTDGGKTWNRVLFVDDKTGVIDLRMDPSNPEALLVGMWERRRDEYDSHPGDKPMPPGYDGYDPIVKWGKGSGLFKTIDGGKSFQKITKGLPTNPLGRIGIDYYRKDPKTVFAIVDCEKIALGSPVYMGIQGADAKGGARLTSITDKSPAAKAGLKVGDLVTALDQKPVANYADLGKRILDHNASEKVVLKVTRGTANMDITVTLEVRPTPAPARPGFLGLNGEAGSDGLRLTALAPNGPGVKAGLKVGDILLTIDKNKVTDPRQLFRVIRGKRPGDKLTLEVIQGKETKNVVLTLGTALGRGGQPQRPFSGGLGGQRENAQNEQGKDGFQYGGIYKSTDGGDSWTRINSLNPRPMYFSQVRVDPSDDKYLYVCGVNMYRSEDGGKKFTPDAGPNVHPDQHALWIDPKDGRHMIVGCDGGFYATYDRTKTWDFLNNVAIGQFYHVCVDSRRPYHVYGGLQDNGSWGGPSHALDGRGPINEDWISVFGGDGFVCRVDPNDPDLVYAEFQDGNIIRRNLKTGRQGFIKPGGFGGGFGGFGGRPNPYRFNWNTPYILSNHNSHILYCGGNFVFRSLKQGDDFRPISPEITLTKWGSATAVAESPVNPDVLFAGTDDGALWVSRDGGRTWAEIHQKVGLPGPRCVASIEPSRFAEGRAYVCFDGHRSNDDEPYVCVTEDYGQTWKSIRANLPTGSSRVLREDLRNADLLFAGTEFAAWVSLDRGGHWTKLNNNLPTVAVHEFAIHPTAGEMVAATHGRSLWVLDITPLRQMTKDVLAEKAHLYEPRTVIRWSRKPARGSQYGVGARHYWGENPASGAQIYYSLGQKASKVSVKVLDYTGKTVGDLQGELSNLKKASGKDATEPGLHQVTWNLVQARPGARGGPGGRRGPGARGQGRGRGRGRGQRGGGGGRFGGPFQQASPGMYRVVLTVDGKEYTQSARIENDPNLPTDLIAQDDDGLLQKLLEEEERHEAAKEGKEEGKDKRTDK